MHLSPGDRVDRYLLCEPLGEGGQGAVWKAQDPLTGDAFVAIKLVTVAGTRPNDTERLRREARALARLNHTSLLKSHALFEDLASGVLGIVMDYVEGTSLRAAQADPRFTIEIGAHALGHIAQALAYVHDAGVTHRDLKLENVLVTSAFWDATSDASNVKLVDFGIAKDVGAQHPLTALDTVIGTLAYLAPELIDPGFFSGHTSAPAVDVFAFGVLAYKLLIGSHPSGLAVNASIVDYAAVYRRAVHGTAPWPTRLGTGPWSDLVRDCLALNQTARIRDGKQLAERLASLGVETVSLATVLPPEEPLPTSIASPRAALAPTEALVAIPGRLEARIPITPPTSASSVARREAPTAPLRAVDPSSPSLSLPGPEPVPSPDLSQSTAAPVVRPEPAPVRVASTISAVESGAALTTTHARAPRTLVWAIAGTLISVGAVLAYRLPPWNHWLHGGDRAPDPIVGLPSSAIASVTRIEPANKPDAAPEAGPVRTLPANCDAGVDAGACPCCPSGQDCGGACNAPVPPDGRWALRVAHVGKDETALLAAHPKAKVCVRVMHVGQRQECRDFAAVRSGADVTWSVSAEDFARYGLDVTVEDFPEGAQVPTPLFQGRVDRGELARNKLCEGLAVDSSPQTETIDRVVFYLDAPGSMPHRCNLP